jgi:hypothetical protein
VSENDDRIDDAIRASVAGEFGEQFMATHWLAIGAALDPQRPGYTQYFIFQPGGEQPTFLSLGLMDIARECLIADGWTRDDDEDDD